MGLTNLSRYMYLSSDLANSVSRWARRSQRYWSKPRKGDAVSAKNGPIIETASDVGTPGACRSGERKITAERATKEGVDFGTDKNLGAP